MCARVSTSVSVCASGGPSAPGGRLGIVAQALLTITTRVPSLRSPELFYTLALVRKVLLRKKIERERQERQLPWQLDH